MAWSAFSLENQLTITKSLGGLPLSIKLSYFRKLVSWFS